MIYKKVSFFFILLLTGHICYSQNKNLYGLQIIDSEVHYLKTVSINPDSRIVEIIKYIPGIKLDIKYATTNNFTGSVVYDEARAFARIPVVLALKSAQKELNKQGLGLKIYDAYRPYSVTVKFFEIAADKNFVASPKTGSRHNRGCAIDLTLVNMRTGKELKMPTPFDSFAPEASPGFNDLPKKVKRNRDLLKEVMERNGFTVLHNEWWHFDFNTWKDYNLMDIPFKQL